MLARNAAVYLNAENDEQKDKKVLIYWWSKSDVEEIIGKDLTDAQWDVFIDHSLEYEINEEIESMHKYLEENNFWEEE